MKLSLIFFISLLILVFVFPIQIVEAQKKTKRLKRPSSRVGVSSVDTFVRESFDLYDKVYRFDNYAETGKPLSDDDYELLIDSVEDGERVLTSAPNAIADLDGAGVLKQGKGALQINRAKKALKYSIKTAKKLLTEKRKQKQETEIDDVLDKKNKKSKKEEETNKGKKKSKEVLGSEKETTIKKKSLEVYRNYKFIPGEKVIFYDDLKTEEVGEFPSRWDLIKGGAEIATFNGEKVILGINSIYNLSRITPLFKNPDYLSDEFTIEYDVYVEGDITKEKHNNRATYNVYLDSKKMTKGHHGLNQDVALTLKAEKTSGFASNSDFPIEKVKIEINSWSHIAMSYHKGKFKLYINETRIINLPKFDVRPDIFIIEMLGSGSFYNDEIRVAIKNIRIAHGGGQMYKRIMADGKYVTNGILFDSGKATIKPQSMGIINKIATIMNENSDWKFKIIGHTDSDGSSEKNLLLSQQRAESVKNSLITLGIKAERLTTLGKGETESLNTNSTPEEKSNNRRVEFVKS